MSPENTHKLMGLYYMDGLILGVNIMYMFFCSFELFPIGCIGLNYSIQSHCDSYKGLTILYLELTESVYDEVNTHCPLHRADSGCREAQPHETPLTLLAKFMQPLL